MTLLGELVVSGIAVGALYGLVGMGFAVIYKATGLVNFAQGEMTMLVTYIAWTIATTISGNVVVVVVGSLLSAVLLGLAIERLIMRPMLGETIFANVMVTVALAVVMRSLVTLVWDAYPHALGLSVGKGIVHLGGASLRSAQIAAICVLLLAMFAFFVFFRFSRFGVAMRSVAIDDRAALLMGIPATRIHAIAWAASAGLAAVAGVLFALVYDLSPAMYHVGLKSFPATLLGGLDSVLGSAVAGVLVGIIENLAGGYLGSGMKDVAGFVLIIVVLMVRPFGLFGEREVIRV